MAKASNSTETRPTKQKAARAETSTEAAIPFADGDLGKIQAILFGEQSHRFEAQLAEMAAKFDQLISQTTSEFAARINALEAEHNRRLDALNKDLANKTAALDTAKLDSKEAGRILAAAAAKMSKN